MYRMPAFSDSHVHFLGVGQAAGILDLRAARSIEDIVRIGTNAPAGPIVLGRGWNQENLIERRDPTRRDLDRIAVDRPVALARVCGHVMVANTFLLRKAGIGPDFRYAGTGTVSYETGIVTEAAIELVKAAYPLPSRADLLADLARADRIFLKHGVTRVASDDFCVYPVPYGRILEAIAEAYERGLVHVRITEQANLPDLETLSRFLSEDRRNRPFGGGRIGPLKLLADGSLGGRTALLSADYDDDPGNRGVAVHVPGELEALVALANRHDMDVVIHAIGDAAADLAIAAIAAALREHPRANHRHAIIHAQMTTRTQIARMKQWGIGAIVQPIFIETDIAMLASRIGGRRRESYLFGSMAAAGLPVGFSSDGPVESIDPLLNLYAAVTRKSRTHSAFGALLPEEAVTVPEAIRHLTDQNRHFLYDDGCVDEIVLSANPAEVPFERIPDLRVLETRMDGKVVYRADR